MDGKYKGLTTDSIHVVVEYESFIGVAVVGAVCIHAALLTGPVRVGTFIHTW